MVLIPSPSKILNRFVLLVAAILVLVSCKHDEGAEKLPDVEKWLQITRSQSLGKEDVEKYVDSVDARLSELPNDSITRYYYRKASAAYFNAGIYDKSLKVSRKVFDMARYEGDTISMGKAAYLQGLVYYNLGIKDTALQYYQKAERYYKPINYSDLSTVILYKAYVFHDVGEYVLCESEATIALKLFKEQKKNYEIYQCQVVIASALNEQENTAEAIAYYRQALDQIEHISAAENSEDQKEFFRAICYHNIGSVYEKGKQYTQAIQQYEKALASPQAAKGTVLNARILGSIAKAKFLKGDYAPVEPLLNQALATSDSLNDKEGLMLENMCLGDLYMHKKDTLAAIKFYNRGYKEANDINSNTHKLEILASLSAADIKNSPKYTKQYVALDDEMQRTALKNRNKYARIEYETDQLKGEKEALIRKNSFIIGVSLIILLFVAAIFIIYYLNSRNKELVMLQEQQKANEEIYQLMFEQQERVEAAKTDEKNRIAMELHDGILNSIYAVRLNLEFSNRKNTEEAIEKRKGYIKELQFLETEIRAVSHDLSRSAKLVQGKDFAHMLEFLVTTQKNNFGTHFELLLDKAIDWENMPNTVKVNIYRIIQEALQNINKYAEADQAYVDVHKDGRQIVINIHYNGVGFDTTKASGGIGIKNLKQRSASLNALLKIESSPENGTNINVQFSI